MATAEQIKLLIRSHFTDDFERFNTIALQVAAHEAKQGHSTLAHEIRNLLDNERHKKQIKTTPFPRDLWGLLLAEKPDVQKASLIIPSALEERIDRIINEYRQQSKLKLHGLVHRRKLLFVGPPGTGKTMTAKVLAHELRLPLYTIQIDRLVTKFMGETSAKLRQIFDLIKQERGIYLFDEFDAIGGERSLENDVGEMRRVLNAFLQFIEQDKSDSLIVAATNNPKLLDNALFRRFDDMLHYDRPHLKDRKRLISNLLGNFLPQPFTWKTVLVKSNGLSHAELDQACKDAIKHAILNEMQKVNVSLLKQMLTERHSILLIAKNKS